MDFQPNLMLIAGMTGVFSFAVASYVLSAIPDHFEIPFISMS